MSLAVRERMRLLHWRREQNGLQASKDAFWHSAVCTVAPSSDELQRIVLDARVADAFAPLKPSEVGVGQLLFTDPMPRRQDVVDAFEAMLLAGEIEAAYRYVGGIRHHYVDFSQISCRMEPEFEALKGQPARYARTAVKIQEARITYDSKRDDDYALKDAVDVIYEARDGSGLSGMTKIAADTVAQTLANMFGTK